VIPRGELPLVRSLHRPT